MYLHGALLGRRAVRVACCLTTMFLREQHTAVLYCAAVCGGGGGGSQRPDVHLLLLWAGGGGISPISRIMAKKFPASTPHTHTCKYWLSALARSHSLTYLPSICPPPAHTGVRLPAHCACMPLFAPACFHFRAHKSRLLMPAGFTLCLSASFHELLSSSPEAKRLLEQ